MHVVKKMMYQDVHLTKYKIVKFGITDVYCDNNIVIFTFPDLQISCSLKQTKYSFTVNRNHLVTRNFLGLENICLN